jgi:hypothetical protein
MRFERLAMALFAAAGMAGTVSASDDCSTATPLLAGTAATGNTSAATPSVGIPASHCAGTSETGNDEWYSYTATVAGSHVISLCGSSFDTSLSLWTGCPDGSLTPVVCNDDSCGLQSSITRTMAEGETLLVRVGGYNTGAGAYTLLATAPTPPPPPPANDNCADATTVVVGGAYTGSTVSGTNDATGSCGLSTTANDVWFTFTAPSDGAFAFSTCDAVGYDTVLSFWDTCGGAEILCDDDSDFGCTFSGLRSEIRRTMLSGETILVRLAGFNGASGSYVLTVAEVTPPPPPPANDDCSGALPISAGLDQPYDTTLSTTSGQAVADCGLTDVVEQDIWFTFIAECTGTVEINTCGTTYDTAVAVFDACGGNQITCSDDGTPACAGNGLASRATFAATAGTTYYIAVGAYLAGVDGPGVISVICTPDVTCPSADFNGDDFVDFFDYDDYVACFENGCGADGLDADFNNDGFVDFFDYDDFVYAFEGCP